MSQGYRVAGCCTVETQGLICWLWKATVQQMRPSLAKSGKLDPFVLRGMVQLMTGSRFVFDTGWAKRFEAVMRHHRQE